MFMYDCGCVAMRRHQAIFVTRRVRDYTRRTRMHPPNTRMFLSVQACGKQRDLGGEAGVPRGYRGGEGEETDVTRRCSLSIDA